MSQTSVSASMTAAVRGQAVDTSVKVDDSFCAEGNITFGNLVQAGTDPENQVMPLEDISAIAADDDSIAETPLATAAADQEFSGVDFDSAVYGAGRIAPAQLVTMTLDAHTDWDDSEAVVVGEGPSGEQREVFVIPDGGDVVLTGKLPFSRVEKVLLDAQTGTNGTFTIGTNPAEMVLSRIDFPGVALFQRAIEPYSTTAEIEDEKNLNVRTFGRIKVQVEAAVVKGDPVFVRTTESGTDLRGQFRGTPASGFHRLAGAVFLTSADTDGLSTLELK